MADDFKILSYREELQLSVEEYSDYAERLRNFCRNRKLQVSSPGAITLAPKLKKPVNKISTAVTKLLAGGAYEKQIEGIENLPEGPVIFACTHQGILDNFVWIPDNPKHALIVHGVETNKLLLAAQYDIGLIYVTKDKGKQDKRYAAKLDIITTLLKGHSIIIFPETAWNLSPNKLHLPLNFGFVDVAKKTGVPIVPMVIEYTYDTQGVKERIVKINIKYGAPIKVEIKDDLIVKTKEYSESVATMRWEILEGRGLVKREEVDNWEYINFLKGNFKNLKLGKIDRTRENNGIQGSNDEFYQYFYINDHAFDEKGNILKKSFV